MRLGSVAAGKTERKSAAASKSDGDAVGKGTSEAAAATEKGGEDSMSTSSNEEVFAAEKDRRQGRCQEGLSSVDDAEASNEGQASNVVSLIDDDKARDDVPMEE